MITISELVEAYIRESPFLEVGLAEGIFNLSALARRLKPRLEKELMKEVSPAAVMMALKRLSEKIGRRTRKEDKQLRDMGDLIVRSNLVEYTFQQSETIWEKQKKLLNRAERRRDTFLTFTQGVFEVMLIASAAMDGHVQAIFGGEKLLSRVDGLSAIVIRLSPQSVHLPGVYYSILKQLAWDNLNVVDVVSTYTEFTLVLENHLVDRAFSVMKRFLLK
jgi:hypothetical protein